jgi:hypothetical protein
MGTQILFLIQCMTRSCWSSAYYLSGSPPQCAKPVSCRMYRHRIEIVSQVASWVRAASATTWMNYGGRGSTDDDVWKTESKEVPLILLSKVHTRLSLEEVVFHDDLWPCTRNTRIVMRCQSDNISALDANSSWTLKYSTSRHAGRNADPPLLPHRISFHEDMNWQKPRCDYARLQTTVVYVADFWHTHHHSPRLPHQRGSRAPKEYALCDSNFCYYFRFTAFNFNWEIRN